MTPELQRCRHCRLAELAASPPGHCQVRHQGSKNRYPSAGWMPSAPDSTTATIRSKAWKPSLPWKENPLPTLVSCCAGGNRRRARADFWLRADSSGCSSSATGQTWRPTAIAQTSAPRQSSAACPLGSPLRLPGCMDANATTAAAQVESWAWYFQPEAIEAVNDLAPPPGKCLEILILPPSIEKRPRRMRRQANAPPARSEP